jgi:hypothetical protein
MGRWDSLPPSQYQRWLARHAVALQVVLVCLAAACAVLAVIVFRSDGWGRSVASPIVSFFVFLGLMWTHREVAQFVTDYDRQHGTTPK